MQNKNDDSLISKIRKEFKTVAMKNWGILRALLMVASWVTSPVMYSCSWPGNGKAIWGLAVQNAISECNLGYLFFSVFSLLPFLQLYIKIAKVIKMMDAGGVPGAERDWKHDLCKDRPSLFIHANLNGKVDVSGLKPYIMLSLCHSHGRVQAILILGLSS